MEPDSDECYFKWKFNCQDKKEKLIRAGPVRITNIIRCSRIYGDEKHYDLENELEKNYQFSLRCHKSCVSCYTSKTYTERHKRHHEGDSDGKIPQKITRRSLYGESTETFSFKKHCLFCGKVCNVERDKKHPDRWREAYVFREIDKKQTLVQLCIKRNDEAARKVQHRLEGVLCDLHAEEARYHVDCQQRFASLRSLPGEASTSQESQTTDGDEDQSFFSIVEMLKNDRSRMWNSVELFDTYLEFGGKELSRRTLLCKLRETFGDELLVLSSPGIASIIAFRSCASEKLRVVNCEEDETESVIKEATRYIRQDLKNIVIDREHYNITMNKDLIKETASDFLLRLLANISPKLDCSLPALLISSIVTSVIKSQATSLQVGLAGKMGESKKLINSMYKYGVCCSYTEHRLFKKSAAQAAVSDMKRSGISNAADGLVQAIVDNFDADISSQNGKQSTHSLAILLTQSSETPLEGEQDMIKRVPRDAEVPYSVDIHRYQGPKQPPMPKANVHQAVPTLKSLADQAISTRRAAEMDLNFLQDILKEDKCPEFHGYNTKLSREQGHLPQPKTKAVYLPLIDMKPSDPDTMLTAMERVQTLTNETGQSFSLLTCDQQLYRVAVQVTWDQPDRFKDMYIRLGGMHALMSFAGAIGSLMTESGLSDILSEVFGGVPKMLSGKKFPQNVRALRMLAEEVLRSLFEDHEFENADDLMEALEQIASQSRTAKLWVEVLVKPVMLMMKYIRAEREGDWLLHLATFRKMLPYYFAAGHVNYARYGLYYLRTMEKLPPHVQSHFLKGDHVTRHIRGVWNGLWSDQFIESTFMRYGHSAGGIIGITLKIKALRIWALSRHICCKLEADMEEMEEMETSATRVQLYHKEEAQARIEADSKDRTGLRQKLQASINPLDPEEHPEGSIVNIISGKIAPTSVNIDDAVTIGEDVLNAFEKSWPEGFYSTIPKRVETMAASNKSVQIGDSKCYDLDVIYSRVIALLSSDRDIDVSDVFSHELAPVPTAMFAKDGMRICKAKSKLKGSLQIEVSRRNAGQADVTVIDGSALLWTVHWPADGVVADFIENVKKRIAFYLTHSDVYLIFDRYHDYSIKSTTRDGRETGVTRKHHLLRTTKLPAQKVVLSSVDNKKQLIRMVCEEVTENRLFHLKSISDHKLVVTGEDPCPIEVYKEDRRTRFDLETHQEEADIIIVQQVLKCVGEAKYISVVSDDTDVFVLLLHHYHMARLEIPLTMESPSKERAIVDIKATVARHENIIENLLPAHAISGCDTVACYFGIGKATVIKALKNGYDLSALGTVDASLQQVIDQATSFISACYGVKNSTDMSHTRLLVWGKKNGKGHSSSPVLATLPPTTEAFVTNVKRAHFQAMLWRSIDMNPSDLNPEEFGWKKDTDNKVLNPTALPDDAKPAPDYILAMIRCGCKSEPPCRTKRCSCKEKGLPCTMFCACFRIGCSRSHSLN